MFILLIYFTLLQLGIVNTQYRSLVSQGLRIAPPEIVVFSKHDKSRAATEFSADQEKTKNLPPNFKKVKTNMPRNLAVLSIFKLSQQAIGVFVKLTYNNKSHQNPFPYL